MGAAVQSNLDRFGIGIKRWFSLSVYVHSHFCNEHILIYLRIFQSTSLSPSCPDFFYRFHTIPTDFNFFLIIPIIKKKLKYKNRILVDAIHLLKFGSYI